MDYQGVMERLEQAGTEQNRKIYGRHGVVSQQFGVSYSELGKLRRKLKRNHPLALQLWDSGNHDARVLACMICDPSQLDMASLEKWADDLDNGVLTDAFSQAAGESAAFLADDLSGPTADHRSGLAQWLKAEEEYRGQAAWNVVAIWAQKRPDVRTEFLELCLDLIEKGIHSAPNRARYAMNNALIAIGIRGGSLQAKALESARRIGPVEVDHGETGCKTPNAEAYILKATARKKAAGKS